MNAAILTVSPALAQAKPSAQTVKLLQVSVQTVDAVTQIASHVQELDLRELSVNHALPL